jgi:hypothetical protein
MEVILRPIGPSRQRQKLLTTASGLLRSRLKVNLIETIRFARQGQPWQAKKATLSPWPVTNNYAKALFSGRWPLTIGD